MGKIGSSERIMGIVIYMYEIVPQKVWGGRLLERQGVSCLHISSQSHSTAVFFLGFCGKCLGNVDLTCLRVVQV